MRILSPLVALFVLFACPRVSAAPDPSLSGDKPPFKTPSETLPIVSSVPDPELDPSSEVEIKDVKISKALAQQAKALGFHFDKTGTLIHEKSGTKITPEMLEKSGIRLDDEGHLVYVNQPEIRVEQHHLKGILDGLLQFGKVASHDPREAGRMLQAWGIPPAYDGVHLLNPDGSATYFGLMLYEGLRENPRHLKSLSGERLSKALSLFETAYTSAFHDASPDAANPAIQRAWGLLNWDTARSDATLLQLTPYSDLGDKIGEYRTLIEQEMDAVIAGGAAPAGYNLKDSEEAILALNTLEKTRYYTNRDLPQKEVPSPQKQVFNKPFRGSPLESLPETLAGGEQSNPPNHSMLPRLLGMVERLHGSPMTLSQQEAFVKSFPLGEIVWEMGAPSLWREGITGEGVRVAVIDTGIGYHPQLNEAVKDRQNFTRRRGSKASGNHATHVAGTIHAIAPDAEIRSYAAINSGQDRQSLESSEIETAILNAIDAAVADGNQVINMSLGRMGHPSNEIAKKVQEYSAEGIVFVISAGNSGPDAGVETPSSAPDALTVGALDAQGRIASFSSSGENWDPVNMAYSIKNIFMARGKNTYSTTKPMFSSISKEQRFETMSGTSMAAPHVSGGVVLLVQAVRDFKLFPDPVMASRRIRESLSTTGRRMSLDELPAGVPPEQEFIIVDVNGAYKRLRSSTLLSRSKK